MPANRSKMMDALYGEELAQEVYDRCQALGDNFNTLVQQVVYDQFWAREGLSIREKSLLTIISLAVLDKAEQLQIHLRGFFKQHGTAVEIASLFKYLHDKNYITQTEKAFEVLATAAKQDNISDYPKDVDSAPDLSLAVEEKELIDFASHIAIGNQEKTKAYLTRALKEKILSSDKLENIMLHQIMYCGFPCAMNGYAALFEIKKDSPHTSATPPERSKMMDTLYGEKLSQKVYERCQELGQQFNELVQRVVYDQFWARKGLSISEKSLATIISLTVLNKAEQLRIHIEGFLAQGGTIKKLASIFKHLQTKQYIASAKEAFEILKNFDTSEQLSDDLEKADDLHLPPTKQAFIDFAAHIAKGDQPKTVAFMTELLEKAHLPRHEIESIMLHQIMYCGFPCAMNGYAALQQVEQKKDHNQQKHELPTKTPRP